MPSHLPWSFLSSALLTSTSDMPLSKFPSATTGPTAAKCNDNAVSNCDMQQQCVLLLDGLFQLPFYCSQDRRPCQDWQCNHHSRPTSKGKECDSQSHHNTVYVGVIKHLNAEWMHTVHYPYSFDSTIYYSWAGYWWSAQGGSKVRYHTCVLYHTSTVQCSARCRYQLPGCTRCPLCHSYWDCPRGNP